MIEYDIVWHDGIYLLKIDRKTKVATPTNELEIVIIKIRQGIKRLFSRN